MLLLFLEFSPGLLENISFSREASFLSSNVHFQPRLFWIIYSTF
jgi:hypothetical protein